MPTLIVLHRLSAFSRISNYEDRSFLLCVQADDIVVRILSWFRKKKNASGNEASLLPLLCRSRGHFTYLPVAIWYTVTKTTIELLYASQSIGFGFRKIQEDFGCKKSCHPIRSVSSNYDQCSTAVILLGKVSSSFSGEGNETYCW